MRNSQARGGSAGTIQGSRLGWPPLCTVPEGLGPSALEGRVPPPAAAAARGALACLGLVLPRGSGGRAAVEGGFRVPGWRLWKPLVPARVACNRQNQSFRF